MSSAVRQVYVAFMTAGWLVLSAQAGLAQQPAQTDPATESDDNGTDGTAAHASEPAAETRPQEPDRLFNILPNGATVEAGTTPGPLTHKQMFTWATESSFDKNVFPFVAIVTVFGAGQSASESYGLRYVTALADNALGNYMVGGVVPALLKQDPRYFQDGAGAGGVWHRATYAATRVVVTRSATGHAQFNISEIGGNSLAATLGNLYYPTADRTARNTAVRAASQVLWDAVSFECKEFWPDIRRRFERGHHHQT
jgi:hypothetical protein